MLTESCVMFFSPSRAASRDGIIKPYEGTILTTVKVCCVICLFVFRLISGYTGERLIPG